MRWKGRGESSNIEDRRGISAKTVVGGGIGSVVVMLLIYLLGGDPGQLQDIGAGIDEQPTGQYQETAEEKELVKFIRVVLKDTENVWTKLFEEKGASYEMPTLVLFSGSVESACGVAGASTGPFYCPGDHKLYIDLSFCDELRERFKAPGDFALAYVIAHEVGHHVQTLIGTSEQVMALRSRLSETEFNKYLVRLELQADYYAGVWAHHASRMNLLEEGDLDEALNAASAVGDDRIQKSGQGYVVPDSFTHGTSAQRKRWFQKGFQSGDMNGGDPFSSPI